MQGILAELINFNSNQIQGLVAAQSGAFVILVILINQMCIVFST